MNLRAVFASAIVSALVGAMIGLSAAKIAERRAVNTDIYQARFARVGGIVGGGLGAFFNAIYQQKAIRESEEDLDGEENDTNEPV